MKPLFICCLFLLFACSREKEPCCSNTVQDTIKVDTNRKYVKSICPDSVNEYYSNLGIIISKYYDIRDSLTIDLNRDGLIDTLVVLSPFSLDVSYNCRLDSVLTRILVEIINCNGYSKIRNIYSNLISNIGGVLSKYNGINLTKEGFEINHSSGAKYTWHYTTEYSTQFPDSIFLVKIRKTCSIYSFDSSVEYHFNKYSTTKVNIPDTLYNQCNCENLWKELEKLKEIKKIEESE